MKSLREEHAQATRNAIISAAREMFTSKGYDASSIDEIAAAARVTSGALYHHFRNKREIMRAVFETMDAELVRRVKAGAQGAKDAADEMRRRMQTLLDICREEDVRSIVYQQAPRVLGWDEYRAADEGYAIGELVDLLSRLRTERKIAKYDNNLLAKLLLAILNEAGFQMAAHRNDAKLRNECERILEAFLSGL
jgi:AcrR family transcriptional regulator